MNKYIWYKSNKSDFSHHLFKTEKMKALIIFITIRERERERDGLGFCLGWSHADSICPHCPVDYHDYIGSGVARAFPGGQVAHPEG